MMSENTANNVTENEVCGMTIAEFIEREAVSMVAVKIPGRPDGVADEWSKTASHYACTLTRNYSPTHHAAAATMTTFYSMGSAHKNPPTCADVLDSLASDCYGVEGSFEDWCWEYGLDSDSRKAEATYRACQDARAKLLDFFGETERAHPRLDCLLYNVERL